MHAALNLNDKLNGTLENNYFCTIIFIDFKKAFDTIDFGIVLDRLLKLGFRNKCWELV